MNFLSIYKLMHELGHPDASSKTVPFPGSSEAYHALYNDSSQDIFARFSIYLCLHPEKAGNSELYNIGNSPKGKSMAEHWPFVCLLFGFQGEEPLEQSNRRHVLPASFIAEHNDMAEWLRQEKGVGLQGLSGGQVSKREAWRNKFTGLDRNFCLDKAKAAGFQEELTIEESWSIALNRYSKAGKVYKALPA